MGKMLKILSFFAFAVSCLCIAMSASSSDVGTKIDSVKVQGNESVLTETIKEYAGIPVPGHVDSAAIDAAVKRLFATGFFSDVHIKTSGSAVIVTVEERPMIHNIAFEGNKEIKDKNLIKSIASASRSIYSLAKIEIDIKIITEMYKRHGYYSVKVNAQAIKLSHNRVDIVYEITEGKKAKIQKIEFIGNKDLKSADLKRAIMSREYVFYRFFSSVDTYDAGQVLMDQELLKQHYMNLGYADFHIESATVELTPALDAFIITFSIHEGDIYQYGDVSLKTSIKSLSIEELNAMLAPHKGSIFNLEEVSNTVSKLTDYLGSKGYAFANVDYDITKNKQNKLATVTFSVDMGKRMYINKINIVNNTRTLDNVIRRELKIAENDPYNTDKVARSRQRLLNLKYFSEVDFQNKRTDVPDRMDIDVTVKEVPTGSVHFTLGYNTSLGAIGGVTLSEGNFLGKGQIVELGFQKAKKGSNINFGFTEPKFLDKDLSAGFDAFYFSQDKSKESSYDSKTVGSTARAGYNITEYLSHGVRYTIKRERVKTDSHSTISLIQKDIGGKRLTSGIGHTLLYDKSGGNFLFMVKGYDIRFSQDVTGLGGDAKYLRHEAIANLYLPLYKEEVILNFTARAGQIDGLGGKKLKLVDNFFIGEEYIRGFEPSGIGPRDSQDKDALGGKIYYSGTAEMTFPLGLPEELAMRGAVFFDCATLYKLDKGPALDGVTILGETSSLRSSYGVGIIWYSPLGKIRVDYGKPMKKEPFDKRQNIRLSLGTNF